MVSSLFDILNIYLDDLEQKEYKEQMEAAEEFNTTFNLETGTTHSSSSTSIDCSVNGRPADTRHFTQKSGASRVMHSLKSPLSRNTKPTFLFARATTDTTLLVLPEKVFRTIARVYPTAATQMVQIILTRFQRVTFLTLYKYLGLTKELLKIEQAVNNVFDRNRESGTNVPPLLRRRDLDRLRELPKRKCENRHGHLDVPRGSAESTETLYETPLGWVQQASCRHMNCDDGSYIVSEKSYSGELGSSKRPRPMTADVPPRSTNSISGSLTEREMRDLVFEALGQALGVPLVQPPPPTILPTSRSADTPSSPVDSRRQSTLHTVRVNDLPSALAASTATIPSSSPRSSRVSINIGDIQNDLQILFFDADAVLVRQGDRHAGIFFVVDGMLEVSMNVENERYGATKKSNVGAVNGMRDAGAGLESESTARRVCLVSPGGLAGYLSALTGHPSFVTIRAKSDTFVSTRLLCHRHVIPFDNIIIQQRLLCHSYVVVTRLRCHCSF